MLLNIKSESVLKLIKDKTFQKASALIVVICCAFFAGRASSPECVQEIICADIIRDKNTISQQLEKQYTQCQEEKVNELKNITHDLNANCAERVDEALGSAEFDENIHCPICVARGVCK